MLLDEACGPCETGTAESSILGRCERHRALWLENVKGRDHLEDLGVIGRIMLEWIYVKRAQDRDQCRAVVKTVMNLRLP
jgi:hypothetical protein